jgi:hypothetical protein
MLALPERLGVELQESFSGLLIMELHKDRSFEELILVTAKNNSVGGTVGGEESFNVELRAGLLVAEALCVDRSLLGLIAFRPSGVISDLALDLLFPLFANDIEESTVPKCSNDCFVWLITMHALEAVNVLD